MATKGQTYLLKAILEKDFKKITCLSKELLFNEELDLYNFVINYNIKYGSFPSFNLCVKELDIDVTKEELAEYGYDYLLDCLRENYSRNLKLEYQGKLKKCVKERELDESLIQMGSRLLLFWNIHENTMISKEQYIDALVSKRRKIIDEGSIGINCGYPTFDKLTGGLQPSEIYLIIGRPKQGKSQILINMTNNFCKQNKKVLFISMEMPKEQIFDRLIGINLGINPSVYRKGQISDFALEKIKEINELDTLTVVEGQFKADIHSIVSLAISIKPDILVIDGGYLIRVNDSSNLQRWEKIEEIMISLKHLAHILAIPVLTSFQLNRTANRIGRNTMGSETLDRIQLSDSISQIMTSGLAIYDDKENPHRKLVEIVRGRHGEDGEFLINWDFDAGNFNEINFGVEEEEEEII